MRRAWAIGAAVVTVAGLAYTTYRPPSLERFNNELSFRGEQGQSLHRLLETSAVERALRCGAVSVPTHKLIPDTRWVLGLGEADVVARSDPSAASARKARYGVAIFPVGRTNILRTGLRGQHRRHHAGPVAGDSAGSRPTSTSRHTFAAPPGVPRPKARPDAWALCLGGVLVGALVLRLWGIKHGLPYVFNVDEASNFVPTAVSFCFTDSYNPHYFINPPGFSYLLHVVFGIWFGGGDAVGRAFAADPTAVFVVARVTSAVLGTAAVGFVYLTAARLYDRRVGVFAALVMAVAFLPVFYSHLALNDVPALLPLAVSAWGSAGVLMRGRRLDWAVAGAASGSPPRRSTPPGSSCCRCWWPRPSGSADQDDAGWGAAGRRDSSGAWPPRFS